MFVVIIWRHWRESVNYLLNRNLAFLEVPPGSLLQVIEPLHKPSNLGLDILSGHWTCWTDHGHIELWNSGNISDRCGAYVLGWGDSGRCGSSVTESPVAEDEGIRALYTHLVHRHSTLFPECINHANFIHYYYKWKNHFFKMKGGYRDGLKHQKGRNKGSLHSKVAQSYMTPSLYLCFIVFEQSLISNKDIGMVSCQLFFHLTTQE